MTGIKPPDRIARRIAGKLGQFRQRNGRDDCIKQTSLINAELVFQLECPTTQMTDYQREVTAAAIEFAISHINALHPLPELAWLQADFEESGSEMRDSFISKRAVRIHKLLKTNGWNLDQTALGVLICGISANERADADMSYAIELLAAS